MPGLPLDDGFHLRMQMRTDDVIHSVGLNYLTSTGFDSATSGKDLAGAFVTNLVPLFVDALSEDTTIEGIYVSGLLPETALPGVAVLGFVEGSRAVGAMAPNTCAVFTIGADSPDLVRKGRIYLGGIAKADLDAGHWDSAFVSTQLTAIADELFIPLVGAGGTYDLAIVRRVSGGVPVTPFAILATTASVSPVCYSQRRRNSRQLGIL